MTIKDLGFRIRRLRELRGLSQLALAKRAGVSQPHLWEVEAGEQPNPGIDFVERVAGALHITVGDLLDNGGQATAELGIFARFAVTARLGVQPASIVKRPWPEPDLRCQTRRGPLAMELVQLVEADVARPVGEQPTLEAALREAWRVAWGRGLEDASVYVAFREDVRGAIRKAAVTPIIEALQAYPPGSHGDLAIRRGSALARAVRVLHVSRWPHLSGPVFTVSAGGSFTDPPIRPVAEHFRTAYRSDAPMEILVYYAAQPVIPATWSHPELRAFITTELERSAFRRAWVYDLASDRVLFVHPAAPSGPGPRRRQGGA